MALTKYLNQTASYEAPDGTDRFGNRTYGAPRTIRVRKVATISARRSSRELKLKNETQYTASETVELGGRIDGEEIMQVEELRDKRGALLGTRFSPSPPNTLGSGS